MVTGRASRIAESGVETRLKLWLGVWGGECVPQRAKGTLLLSCQIHEFWKPFSSPERGEDSWFMFPQGTFHGNGSASWINFI